MLEDWSGDPLNLLRVMPAKGWNVSPLLSRLCAIPVLETPTLRDAAMETSIFLARLLGPSMLVVVAGLIVNRTNYRALVHEFLDSPALIYLAGLLALVAGLAIVLTHNVWVMGWPVIITIFGWASSDWRHPAHRIPGAPCAFRRNRCRQPGGAHRLRRLLSRAGGLADLHGLFRLARTSAIGAKAHEHPRQDRHAA